MVNDATPLLVTPNAAALVAASGALLVNEAANRMQIASRDGPLSFRMLCFLGGLAMIVSNGLAILDRFFSFNFAGAVIAVFGVMFGTLIAFLEAPGAICGQRIKGEISFYAKFLDFTWGRGALYFFCGTLQISNWNMLDWAVGGFNDLWGTHCRCRGRCYSSRLEIIGTFLAR